MKKILQLIIVILFILFFSARGFAEGMYGFYGKVFSVGKAEAGFLYNFLNTNNISLGVGYSASLVFYSNDLDGYYGDAPWSHILFARIAI